MFRAGERAGPGHALVAASVVSALLLAVASVLPPAGLPFPKCLFLSWTGLPCPSCGATRTFTHLAHGRVAEGVMLNPLAVLLVVACMTTLAVLVLRLTVWRRRIEWSPSAAAASRLRTAAWAVLAANWAWLVWHGVG